MGITIFKILIWDIYVCVQRSGITAPMTITVKLNFHEIQNLEYSYVSLLYGQETYCISPKRLSVSLAQIMSIL